MTWQCEGGARLGLLTLSRATFPFVLPARPVSGAPRGILIKPIEPTRRAVLLTYNSQPKSLVAMTR